MQKVTIAQLADNPTLLTTNIVFANDLFKHRITGVVEHTDRAPWVYLVTARHIETGDVRRWRVKRNTGNLYPVREVE